jgi:hypothetical protein
MSIFDDGFDAEDACVLGGTMGFAEESMRAEEEDPEEPLEKEEDVSPSEIEEINLRLIYNMNPGLFNYIVRIAKKQRARWEKDRLAREAVEEELKAIRESEKCLEGLEANDDN